MKSVFQKTSFSLAPGGDRYEWKNAETLFTVPKPGLFVIQITASAKNAKQNNSTDDDDLRVAVDGFSFGRYEKNDDEISWKGFNTSASFNGASLKGGTKTIYFFVELEKGDHNVQFFADGGPEIESLEIFAIEDNKFNLENLNPPENIEGNQKGIPWLSFIFLGTPPKNILLDVDVKSAKEKGATDCDNLKIVLNGKILQNERVPSSKKYKNFYFSGDIKSAGILSIGNEEISKTLAFENSLELWYDQAPKINSLSVNFFDVAQFLEDYDSMLNLRKYVLACVWLSIAYFKARLKTYSAKFLENSLKENPNGLIFEANHPIVKKIKADPAYKKVLEMVQERITAGILEGELWPDDIGVEINFDSSDLATAIHGIKKIEYKTKNKKGKSEINMIFFDIYDFKKEDVPFFLFHPFQYFKDTIINAIDTGEDLQIINNFEIEVHVNDKI